MDVVYISAYSKHVQLMHACVYLCMHVMRYATFQFKYVCMLQLCTSGHTVHVREFVQVNDHNWAGQYIFY